MHFVGVAEARAAVTQAYIRTITELANIFQKTQIVTRLLGDILSSIRHVMLFIIVRKNCRTGRRCVVWILTVTVRRTARSLVIQTVVGLRDRHRRVPTTFLIQVRATSVSQFIVRNFCH